MSSSLASSVARDVIQPYEGVLRAIEIAVPDMRDYVGAAYLPAFEATINALARWLESEA